MRRLLQLLDGFSAWQFQSPIAQTLIGNSDQLGLTARAPHIPKKQMDGTINARVYLAQFKAA